DWRIARHGAPPLSADVRVGSEHIPSGLLPKADIVDAFWHFRFVPIGDIRLVYSITSSARAKSAAGTVMPSALAVFILMTSWKRVGCSTGRSAGVGAFWILLMYTAAF